MPYYLLWDAWKALLGAVTLIVGLGALVGLLYLVAQDPTRADAWVWGLGAATVVSHLVGAVSEGNHHRRRPRLRALYWVLQVICAGVLLGLDHGAQGLVVLGYVAAASVVVELPSALGLWPGPIADRSHLGAGR